MRYATDEQLRQAYAVEKLTMRQVMARFGYKSLGSLHARLVRAGIPRRAQGGPKDTATRERARRLRDKGMTLQKIGDAIGRKSRGNVKHLLES